MANNTGIGEQESLNGSRRSKASTVVETAKQALGDVDINELRESAKEVIQAGDELRRTRPLLFWGAVCSVGAILTYVLFRPSRPRTA